MEDLIRMLIKILFLDILPPLADWMRDSGGFQYLWARAQVVLRHYLIGVCDRRTLGIPYLSWECIGGVMGSSLPDGRITHQDTKDVPEWLRNRIHGVIDLMCANGQPPLFNLKTTDKYNIYWIVSTIERGSPVLVFYRRPRLLIW